MYDEKRAISEWCSGLSMSEDWFVIAGSHLIAADLGPKGDLAAPIMPLHRLSRVLGS